MKGFFAAALLGMLGAAVTPATAAGDVPSCYSDPRLGVTPGALKREVFVVIDQTTLLDATVRQTLADVIKENVVPGSAYVVFAFSAFGQGRAVTMVGTGTVESGLAAGMRNSISVPALKNLETCLNYQQRAAVVRASAAIQKAIVADGGTLAHSDIMASLREIAPRVAASPAKERLVVIASDMLENSSSTSFYRAKGVRRIDPTAELVKATDKHLIGDFNHARVFVLGAGTLADPAAYRDAATMDALQQFWSQWFERSNAALAEFGRPYLLRPIR